MERCRIVFSGSGGQGIITAAILIAEAAVLYEGLMATQTQSYGAEARGGVTRADVIIADQRINFPLVNQPNILVCLTQEAYDKYSSIIRPGGILITDNRYVLTQKRLSAQQRELPIYQTIIDKIGNPIVLNICMLGALIGMTKLISFESVMKAIETHVPANSLVMNKKALSLGIELGTPFFS